MGRNDIWEGYIGNIKKKTKTGEHDADIGKIYYKTEKLVEETAEW